jgi:mannose-1-phosphate guanylyltransferase/mannose-6-phosphate isomerase
MVHSDEMILTAVVGLEDIVVVATGGAVLVTARGSAEQVKDLVEQLKAQNKQQAVEHLRIYRPWGYYQARFQVMRIVVKPSAKLSLQKHFHRAEHWVVVRGIAEVTVGAEVRIVHENESAYIPIASVHRLANPGKIPLELIEVQTAAISVRTTSYVLLMSMVATEEFFRDTLRTASAGKGSCCRSASISC